MIPTSIDGTDITGATIDGTDVQEITVDGDVVFSAGGDTKIDSFETYNTGSAPPNPWIDTGESDPNVRVTSTPFGSQTVRFDTDPGNDKKVLFTSVSSSDAFQVDKIQFAYNEQSSSMTGVFLYAEDANGNLLLSIGTDNPAWEIFDDNGTTILNTSPSPQYGAWRKVEVTFDWPSGEFDVLWEDITGSSANETFTGVIKTPNVGNVAEIGVESSPGGQGNLGCDIDVLTRFNI